MNTGKRYPLLAVAMMTGVLFLISACSQITVGGSGSNNSGSSSLTVLQVLQNSSNAMQQLKSSHIEVQTTNSYQGSNISNQTVTVKGNGDEALPDAEELHLTVNQNTNLAEIVKGDQVYVQNAQGQWYVLNKKDFTGLVSNPFSSVNINQNDLLGLVLHSDIKDHGKESLNGQDLRHISADLDKVALKQLLEENPQLQGSLGKENVDEVLNRTKSFKATIDVWIDESQFYVHRTQLQLNLTADTQGVAGSTAGTVTTDLNTIVDLSKFNDQVTITPPANATPTDDPATVFGAAKP